MSITKLSVSELYKKCDLSKFDFNSTVELEERLSSLGQERAISAVELGVNIKSKGYNLFCFGPEGTGKMSLVKRILEKEAAFRPTPKDWAYVYNFEEPYKPIAISFEAGEGTAFAKDVDDLIVDLSSSISSVLESEEYKAALNIVQQKYKNKKDDYIKFLQKKAKGKSVSLLQMPVGLVVAPVKNGEVLNPEAFDALSPAEKEKITADLNAMQAEIENSAQDVSKWEEKQRAEIEKLREKFIKNITTEPIEKLRQEYKKNKAASDFLKSVSKHILDNIDDFLP
ncbi:MAG TPA: hypothetical protein DIC64_03955, partial [Alphaproteobacteria bacterium]|nr:hypothetical protein [Alphaproteobacteria bacterium]